MSMILSDSQFATNENSAAHNSKNSKYIESNNIWHEIYVCVANEEQ